MSCLEGLSGNLSSMEAALDKRYALGFELASYSRLAYWICHQNLLFADTEMWSTFAEDSEWRLADVGAIAINNVALDKRSGSYKTKVIVVW